MFKACDQLAQLLQRRLILFREFKEHACVFDCRLELFLPRNGALHATALGHQLLRRFLIAPEVLRGGLLLYALHLRSLRSNIKETSRVVRRAVEDRRKSCVILVMILSLTFSNYPSR